MSRLTLVLVAALALSAWIPAAASSRPRVHPRLSLAGSSPLEVRGGGFRRHERVRVVARPASGEAVVRRVTAGRSGGFTARFPGVSVGPCAGLSVRARGARGSRATLRGLMRPACIVA